MFSKKCQIRRQRTTSFLTTPLSMPEYHGKTFGQFANQDRKKVKPTVKKQKIEKKGFQEKRLPGSSNVGRFLEIDSFLASFVF